jgi:predicted RNase H-like HicB family nuclease
MNFTVETEVESDGRWLAEVTELPGVLTYGQTREEAIARVQALALRVLADRIEHGESVPESGAIGLARGCEFAACPAGECQGTLCAP